MLILDKPFVSDLLLNSISKNGYSILENDFLNTFELPNGIKTIDQSNAQDICNSQDYPIIYSNSENSIGWISKNLVNTLLPEKINLFKDKLLFRELLKELYPKFYFKKVDFNDLENLNIQDIPKPFVIKPAIGFFSMGVYKVFTSDDWKSIPQRIKEEVKQTKNLYPKEVMNPDKFIIEELIEGDEFAFDVYFNKEGEPVVLGILKHLFSSDDDVSDRVYYTSKDLIEEHLQKFTAFAKEIGDRTQIRNFPMHIEIRVNKQNEIVPIEINPMRFGGWCTTADLTTLAFNFDVYQYYFEQKKPDWDTLLKEKQGLNYCLIVLDNSTGFSGDQIQNFDYEKLRNTFSNTLDLRKVNWKTYPVFGFIFTETPQNSFNEIKAILKSDLKEFITLTK